jgi:hypothetical protein
MSRLKQAFQFRGNRDRALAAVFQLVPFADNQAYLGQKAGLSKCGQDGQFCAFAIEFQQVATSNRS